MSPGTTRTAKSKALRRKRLPRISGQGAAKTSSSLRGFIADNKPALSLAAILLSGLFTFCGLIMLRQGLLALGGAAIVVGIGGVLISSRHLNTAHLSVDATRGLIWTWFPVFLPLLALVLAGVAAAYVAGLANQKASQSAPAIWLCGLACFAVGILWVTRWRFEPETAMRWLRSNRLEVVLLIGILVAAAAARFYALGSHPFPPAFDEATVGLEGMRVVRTGASGVFNAGWSGDPNLAFLPSGVAVSAFGQSILVVRGVSAFLGVLTVLSVYLLGREAFGWPIGLMAAAFLATLPVHLQFSRLAVLTVQDGLVATFTLWLLLRAVRTDRLSSYMWAGFATGAALYAYVGGRLAIALAVSAFILVAMIRRGWVRSHVLRLAVYAGGAVITLAPMAVYFFQHPQVFNSRLGQVGIVESGWLSRELTVPGKTLGGILVDQFSRSTLVYIAQGAYGNFFNSPQPYLTLIGSLLFLIGMGAAFQQILKLPFALLLVWFWAVVLFGSVLTVGPPATTRLVMSIPAVAIFVALGLQNLLDILARTGGSRAWRVITGAAILLAMLAQNVIFYFGVYRQGDYFDDPNAELMLRVGLQLKSLGPGYSLYLLGLPRVSTRFPTVQFLDPANPEWDLQAGDVSSSELSLDLPALVAATADNKTALQMLSQRFPGGRLQTVFAHGGSDPLYYAYVLHGVGGP